MKTILNVSLGSSQRNYHFTTTIANQKLDVQRIGTDGDIEQAKNIVRLYDGQVNVISLSGIRSIYLIGNIRYIHRQAIAIASQAHTTPVVDGRMLKTTLERWAIKRTADIIPGIFQKRRILLISGFDRYPLVQALEPHTPDICFADPIIQSGLSFLPVPRSLKQLNLYVKTSLPFNALFSSYQSLFNISSPMNQRKEQCMKSRMQKLFTWADVIIGDCETIQQFAPTSLCGITIITDDPSPEEIEDLRNRGVATLVTITPPLSQSHPFVTTDVLEAIIAAVQENNGQFDEAKVLDFIVANGWEPSVQELNNSHDKTVFAFVIHPLNIRHILHHPRFHFARYLPPRFVEWTAAYMPPIYLSRIRGIRSKATGKEIEGILFSLGATPREMMRRSPMFTYKRLIKAAHQAERMGAKIMGLGAFTSVVGDAGVTVAQYSHIGITTGNSLTVAATLEAAKRAVLLMGGRIDQGCAIVIGATGSIGAVCARLLAMAIHHVILIAPRPERLLALKVQIEHETVGAHVIAATSPDPYIGHADLVVTTTSSLQGRVINVEKLKPGAVICDVARPPNVLEEEVAHRPDVLVVESGEIHLPGEPDFGFNIDLPPGTAYACLAETALLAMEGYFDDYTLGRDIEIERAKEMYRLMKKHGLELSGLRSFGKYITDQDIAQKRRFAEEYRKTHNPLLTGRHGTMSEVCPIG